VVQDIADHRLSTSSSQFVDRVLDNARVIPGPSLDCRGKLADLARPNPLGGVLVAYQEDIEVAVQGRSKWMRPFGVCVPLPDSHRTTSPRVARKINQVTEQTKEE
jgi:hypothetical protein